MRSAKVFVTRNSQKKAILKSLKHNFCVKKTQSFEAQIKKKIRKPCLQILYILFASVLS